MGARYSPLVVANAALVKFGSAPIQTFDDSTPAGTAIALLYPIVMNGLFAEYPWRFALQTIGLNQLDLPALSDGMLEQGWQNAFQLPANIIGLPSRMLANNRYPDGPETRYEIQGQAVYTDQIALWAVCQVYVDEDEWPDYFAGAAIDCLAAEIYPMISGNGNMWPRLQQKAWGDPEDNRMGGTLGLAKRIDSRNNPSPVIAHNPLIDVRTGTIEVIPTGATFP